jgi:ADP-ribosyl-[dinitrogen reductase] hydrolase
MALQWSERLPIGPGVVLGAAPGSYGGTRLADDIGAIRSFGACAVITLIEDEEFGHLEDGTDLDRFESEVEHHGMRWLHVPLEDFEPPTPRDIAVVRDFIERQNALVYLHCMAGLGRAGTVAAALLIDEGMPVPDAMMLVRWVRPGAIQSETQEQFLRRYGEERAAPQP